MSKFELDLDAVVVGVEVRVVRIDCIVDCFDSVDDEGSEKWVANDAEERGADGVEDDTYLD